MELFLCKAGILGCGCADQAVCEFLKMPSITLALQYYFDPFSFKLCDYKQEDL
jgi:hypothetical protein